jgi:D-alanine-D-alanine ligase
MTKSDVLVKLGNKRIGVLYGGLSSEREISIKSGRAVLSVLEKLKLNVCGIDVGRDIVEKIKKEKVDIAYIVLHGQMGEDGAVQGMLEILGIPYTGCGVLASAVSMDKDISKKLFKSLDILTPEWEILNKFDPVPKIREYPVVIKPVAQGSTIGVTIVKEDLQFADAAKKAFKYGEEILIEQFIKGKEITVGVLEGKALPVVEIIPGGEFYDFMSKYQKGGSQHIVPARIGEKAYKTAQKNAEKIYEALRCRAICRFDMIVSENDSVWVLENNTVPGMTETSLIPDAGKAIGYDFEGLVLKILESAF